MPDLLSPLSFLQPVPVTLPATFSMRSSTLKEFVQLFKAQVVGGFVQKDLIGVKLTTDGSWDGTTANLMINVYALYEGLYP